MIGSADVYLFDEPTSGLVLEGFRARHRDHPRAGAQQDHHRHDPPAELEALPDVSQGDPVRQRGAPRLSSARRPTCCATSPRPSISINSAPSLGPARRAERRGRNSSSTCWRRRCAISAATSSTRRTPAGQLVAARRYSPEFWRDKYEAFRLIQDVKQVSLRRGPAAGVAGGAGEQAPILHAAGATNGRNCARCCSALVHEQAAQPREPRHHDRRRAGPGPAHRDAPALLGQRRIRFRVRLSHPDVPFPQPDRGDVPRPDEQRRRHHSRPRGAAARTQSERPPALLRFLEVRLARLFRALPVHPLCPDRQLHPRRFAGCSGSISASC